MDDHNVHNFWGASPFVDFGHLRQELHDGPTALDLSPGSDDNQPLSVLQVGAQDCRHTLATMCRAHRHVGLAGRPLHLYVVENEPEVLARHVLLISVLLDESYPVRDRVEMFLEIHGNALLSEKTAAYLEVRAKAVEGIIMDLNSGEKLTEGLGAMVDISLLKYEQRDRVADALRKTSRKVDYDMAKAWDARLRKNLGDRFDSRRNLVDWDYHMRLQREKKEGMDLGKNSIIHFVHFREWRLHGVAYELRDVVYKEANRSLLSTAYGRTKEFKDRLGADRGRSVSAWGYWGDLISSPYHSFGTISEEPAFFKIANKAYTHTAVDIAQYNLTGFINELRSSEVKKLQHGEEAPRADASRGVTSQENMEKAQRWTGEGEAEDPQAHEREQEARLDAHAREECSRVKIFLSSGELKKTITGKKKFAGLFDCLFVGAHSVHLLDKEYNLRRASKPGALLAVETGENLLFLNEDAIKEFTKKTKEFADGAGWKEADRPPTALPDEHLLFRNP